MRIVFIINTYNAIDSLFSWKIELLLILSKVDFVIDTEIIIILIT